ncbi:trimeric intracellular cation channel family protein [Luteolibacter sp. AS25]|uniref:trimeric intracellular cation channel family protein n=1 Tax=Luteolibacter sp. AS25 TaxID=3135776 RepID=UPI00398ACA7E
MPNFLYFSDLIGVFFFAISGAIAGRKNEMDIFGMFMLALVTCIGGGTLRSLLIGVAPPPVLVDPAYVTLAAAATVVSFFAEPLWERWQRAISVFDAVGLGVFVCIGVQVAQQQGLSDWASLGMGVVTATFGGVLRDLFRAEVPLIFRKEIYATAALLGGLVYLGIHNLGLPTSVNIPITTVVTAGVRLAAIRFGLRLPGQSL